MRTSVLATIRNALNLVINPATEEKQDDIITAIQGIGGASQYALQLDEASATVSYIGEAPTGSSTGDSVWRIKKMDTTTGTVITWADGNDNFDNVWDDRAILSYA